jgi:hypothetical protein
MTIAPTNVAQVLIASCRPAAFDVPGSLTGHIRRSHVSFMALAKRKTTVALDPENDRLLSQAARERGVSRSEFIRQHLALVLEHYRRHPKPRSAGVLRDLAERGDERELLRADR